VPVRRKLGGADRLSNQLGEIARRTVEDELSGVYPRDIEQLADEPSQAVGLRVQDRHSVTEPLNVELLSVLQLA